MEHKPTQMSGSIGEQPASKATRQAPELNPKNLPSAKEEHCSRAVGQKRTVAIPLRKAPTRQKLGIVASCRVLDRNRFREQTYGHCQLSPERFFPAPLGLSGAA